MTNDRRRTAVQYGRACQACFLAKCRCVPREEQDGCERCYKHNKKCVPSDSPRRRAGERNASLARILELEQRINGFVDSMEIHSAPAAAPREPRQMPESVPRLPNQASSTQIKDPAGDDEASEVWYSLFVQRMIKYFPIVHIPRSPEELQRDRPFLLLCIRAVASQCLATKLRLGRQIKQVIANRLVLDGNTDYEDLDLLQGLLTFIAWSHDHLMCSGGGGAPNVSRLTQLAVTMVYEMGLNKENDKADTNCLPVGNIPGKSLVPRRTWPHTMEEKRTLVGCFLLSSVASVYFGQTDPLPYTAYLQSCVQAMACSNDSPYDQALAHMTHIYSVVNDVEVLRRKPGTLAVYDKLFHHRIDELSRTQPSHDESHNVLQSSTYFAQLNVQTLALASDEEVPAMQRMTQLWACVKTVKLAFDNFFALPVEDYDSLPFPYFAQLASFIAVLIRLTTLQAAGWDMPMVRATVDVVQVLEHIIENIDRAKMLLGKPGDDGFLERKMVIFASCKMACVARIAETEAGALPACDAVHDPEGAFGDDSIDAWFRDAFGYGMLGVTSIMM